MMIASGDLPAGVRQRPRTDPPYASSSTDNNNNQPVTGVAFTQAVPTSSTTPLPTTTRISQKARAETGPTIENSTDFQTDTLSGLQDESTEQNMDLSIKNLSPVYDAYHNAALPTSATKRVGCTPGTRVKLLETAQEWINEDNPAKIFWLNGMAGTGKTTIAYTLCEMLQKENLLGASFFCSRYSADCQDVNRIVPTIAYQLGHYSSLYRSEVLKALKSYSDISKRNISAQFGHLILKPFEKVRRTTTTSRNVIVVIDALDECTDETGTRIVLDMLIRHAANLPIKFFVASRPEPTISDIMEGSDGALRSIFWLHDIETSLVQADIELYLTEALACINVPPPKINQLAARAGNLFIFAATAVRYILPDRGVVNRNQRLQTVLELQPSQKHKRYEYIDNLYAAILANALDKTIYEEEEIAARRQVLKSVICAREPLTMPALAEILRMSSEEDVLIAIQPLQSLLYVSAISRSVSALHASFPDFLLSKDRAGQFYCDGVIQNAYLAERCFELMGRSLKFNICGLESSYTFDKDVPNLQCRVDRAISTGLFYSCRYWSDHLTKSPTSPTLLSLLHRFLRQQLLFWMEVLSLKGQIGHGDVALSQVPTWLPVKDKLAKLRDFAYDARNFLTTFVGNPTSLSTPHIYVSVLPLMSKGNLVRGTYLKRTRGLVRVEGALTEGREKSALATWVVGGAVHTIAQSSDGKRVASGSDNNEVSVWDVSSGALVLGPLQGHTDPVQSVAFSPDNSRIASGSKDGTIRVWDARTGNLVVGPLGGYASGTVLWWTPRVMSVAFSPNGAHLASGCSNGTVQMWNALTGTAVGRTYKGHSKPVQSVAFSPDGQHLAYGSLDGLIRVQDWQKATAAPKWTAYTVRVWNRSGGDSRNVAPHLPLGVTWITYSPDGLRLASGSDDHTVRVWDTSRNTLLSGLYKGHTKSVTSVSFSPNGTHIVSSSGDHTIRVWEAESGKLLAGPFKGHGKEINEVLFTTDGTRILSASDDGTIRVWDARQGKARQTESLGHSGGITCVAVSPDGTRAVSGSCDQTIYEWDTGSGGLVASPFKAHSETVTSVAFSPDRARIVSGSYDCTLRTWDASTGAMLAGPFEGHTALVLSVAFSPNGRQIASGSGDCTIRLWDSHTGTLIAEPFEGHTCAVLSVTLSPDGARIVSGSIDKTVRMWDAINGIMLWTSCAHADWVNCVAFSSDGTRVVSGSNDKTILVLAADSGAVLRGPFVGHTSRVISLAFSPDGTRVVSGSKDRTVLIWGLESGTVVAGPFKGHADGVKSVAFSPDGARVFSGSADGTVRFWDIGAAIRPNAGSFNKWSIAKDGWVTNSQSQPLFWLPDDLRNGFELPTPSNPLISNARTTARIDGTMLLGDRWCECYDTSLQSALP